MKILITTDLYKPLVNGVVTSVINIKKGLELRGHEVRILTLAQDTSSYEKDGVYYIGSLNSGWVYPGTRIRLKIPHAFMRDIVRWNPDIVHSQCEFSTYGCAKKISRICGAPLVHTYHTVYEDYTHYFCPSKKLGTFLVSKFSRHVLNHTDAVIAPSYKVGRLLERYGVSTPVSIIPSGIDIVRYSHQPTGHWIDSKRSEYGLDGGELRLIYVGRLAKEKNIGELLDMMAGCRELPVKLLIVGDGPAREEIEEHCERLGLMDKVSFTGMISPDKVGEYYHIGDVFVNASTSETQGLTYVEAMAAGLPMLCKADECLEGLVKNGVNGWQFSNAAEFREHVEKLIADPGMRKRMSVNAVSEAQRFSTANFVDSVERLYMEAIKRKYVLTGKAALN